MRRSRKRPAGRLPPEPASGPLAATNRTASPGGAYKGERESAIDNVCLLPLYFLLAAVWALWLLRSPRASALLPAQRRRFVPWTGPQLVVLFVLVLIVLPSLVGQVLTQSGFFTRLLGPDFPAALKGDDPAGPTHLLTQTLGAQGAAAAGAPLGALTQQVTAFGLMGSGAFPLDNAAVRKQASAHVLIWQQAVSWPLAMAAVFALLPLSGARPYQMGLTTRRLGRNVIVGVCSWCALTGVVFGLNNVLTEWWKRWVAEPTEHPLTRLVQAHPLPVESLLAVLSAVVLAPVLEEVIFRGLLQPWFASRPRGADAGMVGALAIAVMVTLLALAEPGKVRSWRDVAVGLAPVWLVLAAIPGYLVLDRLLRWRTAGAIYTTGLLFGIVHASVWPTPLSLFLFGIGLGLVAYRTQSLVPSIVCHALFNSVSFLILLLPHEAPIPEKGKDVTPACRCAPAASTSSAVPGSE
jgi:membrane protease YdiL (CAAX protease family)